MYYYDHLLFIRQYGPIFSNHVRPSTLWEKGGILGIYQKFALTNKLKNILYSVLMNQKYYQHYIKKQYIVLKLFRIIEIRNIRDFIYIF